MKHFTKLFGVAYVALFAMLLIASDTLAQQTVVTAYVDLVNGSSENASVCTTPTTNAHNTPCDLATALGNSNTDVILLRVRREGGSVTLAAPTIALNRIVTFGTYVRGSGDAKKGTIEFTGDFKIGPSGQLAVHSLATVHVEDVTVTDVRSDSSPSLFEVQKADDKEKNPSTRLRISGDLTTFSARISALTVSHDLMIKGSGEAPILQIDALTINSGVTLTVGTDEGPIDLRVPLRKRAKDDPEGIMTVNGMIDGPGTVWIAHVASARLAADFHMSSDYAPDSRGAIDHDDCVRIAGRGEIKNEIRAIAAGNICVELAKIADLTVAGSIGEGGQADAPVDGDITTDVIFRNAVEIDGDVVQWNDARVVFEKTATITGDVILDDGTLPTTLFRTTTFGAAYTERDNVSQVVNSIRHGVKLASAEESDPFSCSYLPKGEVRIVDNPVVTLSATPTSVNEGGTVTVTATLSKAHPDPVSVTIPLTATGTATADMDYTITGPFRIQIQSGETQGMATIGINNDTVPEDAETIIVSIADDGLKNARKGRTSSVSITINASDQPSSEALFVDSSSDGQFFKTQDTATAGRGFYIPGVQFEDAVTIEGDLDVRSSIINNVLSAPNRNVTRCAPRVIFAAKAAGRSNSSIMSDINGDLILRENDQADRILLDAVKSGTIVSAHNLGVGRDIFIDNAADDAADAIELREPAAYKADGTCTGSDGASLTAGTYLMFPEGENHVITGSLTIEALVVQDDLEVDSGTLTVDALHIGEDGEIDADDTDVVVGKGLILQGGGVDGSVSGEFTHLTYASARTDAVSGKDPLEVLEVHLDSRRLRLEDTRTNVKNLGLCSGTLELAEVENTAGKVDSTMYVTDKLVVQAGSFTEDSAKPGRFGTDKDGYILQYVNKEPHEAGVEWLNPNAVVLSTGDRPADPAPKVTVKESKEIPGKLHIMKGEFHIEGDLTVGASATIADKDRFLDIHKGATLDAKGNKVVTHGHVTVNGTLKTDGGDLHVLGNDKDSGNTDIDDPKMAGAAENRTAIATVGAEGMIDVKTLQLGPEYTKAVKNAKDAHRGDESMMPEVRLEIAKGGKVMGAIHVPKGSKRTYIQSLGDDAGHSLETIVFDGTKNPQDGTNPKEGNHDGTLYLEVAKDLTVDSLSAVQGSVEFLVAGKSVINKAVSTSSATIWSRTPTLEFKKHLKLSGTGGLSNEHHDGEKAILIHGDFIQEDGTEADNAGVWLDENVTKTVMGKFMVAEKAHRYVTVDGTTLKLNGDVNYALKALAAKIEFVGKSNQKVKSAAPLGDVIVNNSKGITLDGNVTQSKMATLTLTRGVISGEGRWVVTNPAVEADLVNRVQVRENGVIFRSSRQSYVATPLTRSLQPRGEDDKAGYLFPAGAEKDGTAYYRPLILQLATEEDEEDSTTVTVSPETIPADATPSWPAKNITVPASGKSLTLDAYAKDIFWRVQVGDGSEDELVSSPSIRVQAHGINNVSDYKRLRIVQWDCNWDNARLAGQYIEGENSEDSFENNGYVKGELNLTQTGIALGSCSILGIAANGIENPIHLSRGSTVQTSQVQFIHNAIIGTDGVDLSLDGVDIASGVKFQKATGYLTTTAGVHTATIKPIGAPENVHIPVQFTTKGDQAYAMIAHGAAPDLKAKLLETKLTSSVNNMVEAIFVHGVAGAGM